MLVWYITILLFHSQMKLGIVGLFVRNERQDRLSANQRRLRDQRCAQGVHLVRSDQRGLGITSNYIFVILLNMNKTSKTRAQAKRCILNACECVNYFLFHFFVLFI